MKALDEYLKLQQEIFDYFGYVEDWRVIPLKDSREMIWKLNQDDRGGGSVRFAETQEQIESDGDYYENEIYTQRFLPKWVYVGENYTMICVDTHIDGNQFLKIFDNAKQL